jgi:hypothetical protein
VSIPSDDALFFVRSVERFSVLEFSPHFPGYPGFVLGARVLDLGIGDPVTSVFLLSALAGLSIPIAVYFWVRGGGGSWAFALAAAACALLQPVLPALSLSMLSDPVGLALALWHLVALQRGRLVASGLLLGLCVAARPSYAVMAAVSALCVGILKRERCGAFFAAFAAVGVVCAAFVLAADGLGYFSEGLRFVSGHFSIWGRGPATGAAPGWAAVLAGLVGGYGGLALCGVALAWSSRGLDLRNAAELCAVAMAVTYGFWVIFGQNPDHPRHAAPIVFLGLGIAGVGLARVQPRAVSAAVLGGLLAHTMYDFTVRVERGWVPAPLTQASRALAARPDALVITQRGVETLRAQHPELRILDGYYEASARFAARNSDASSVLRLSASAAPSDRWQRLAEFPARFPGETGLSLYEWRPGRSETSALPRR